VRKPEGRRPLGRRRRRCEDNIKLDLREIGCGGMGLLACLRVGTSEGCCEHGYEPWDYIKF
jgi:hypothetical protein